MTQIFKSLMILLVFAKQNNIGAGTVSSIVASYKVGLAELDFDSSKTVSCTGKTAWFESR